MEYIQIEPNEVIINCAQVKAFGMAISINTRIGAFVDGVPSFDWITQNEWKSLCLKHKLTPKHIEDGSEIAKIYASLMKYEAAKSSELSASTIPTTIRHHAHRHKKQNTR